MDQFEQRKKKLEAGKEKLAAFQKKKSKSKKTVVADKESRDDFDHQNGEELKSPDVSSPSAFSVTDSDQFSFTSGDEWSAEESDQKSSVYYQTKLADVEQRTAGLEEAFQRPLLAWDAVLPLSEQNNMSDVESALAKRDELIYRLTQSLQSSVGQNIPKDEAMSQVHALAEHVLTLQNQLQQADQSLQEQLKLHESSALALQAAKEQMLQLQVIINYKDTELRRMFQMVEKNAQVIHSLEINEAHAERNLQEAQVICEQYIDRVKSLEEDLHKKVQDCEKWSYRQQEWNTREQELLASLNTKSEEVNTFLMSQQTLHYGEHRILLTDESQQKHLEEGVASNQELLKVLESQLAELRHQHESDISEIAMLKKRNTELETETSDYTKHICTCESLKNEHETLLSQHSQGLSQIQHLTLLNSDLQGKLSSVETNLAVLSKEYEQLNMSYQEEIQTRSQYVENESYMKLSANCSVEKDTLSTQIIELSNDADNIQATSRSDDAFDSSNSLVAQLHQELQQKDYDLNVKLYELAEMQAMVQTLRCSYQRVEETLISNEEIIASLTQELQAAAHGQQAADLEEVITQKCKLEQTVNDLHHRLKEKDQECRHYTENIVKLQDELMSVQHVHGMEMSEREHHLESLEEYMAMLNSERVKLEERTKDLEQRLKIECQQYMDNLQCVAAEKEMEGKQYTENIVTLQDELMSIQHSHNLELSEKEHQFERIEEQLEMLGMDRFNLAQKVKDLEQRLNLAVQENMENLKHVQNEKEKDTNKYAENIVNLQDELISAPHVSDIQKSDSESHFQHIETRVEILEMQRATLSQKVSILEQELSSECEQRKEAQEKKADIESQLQVVIADRESLLKTVESLTTEIQILKKDLQDAHVEYKLKYESHDLNFKHYISNEEIKNNWNVVEEMEKITSTNSQTEEMHDTSYSDIVQERDNNAHSNVHDLILRLEHQQKLAIQHQAETEQLKVQISVIDTNDELRQTKTALQAIAAEVVRAQAELRNHMESFLNKMRHFEMHKQDTESLQKKLLELKTVHQRMSEREAGQDELQAQLENTISQWQRLQVIVQEKEIELHKLEESLEEQQRICSSMIRSHKEQRDLLQAEIDSLKTASAQKDDNVIQVENQLFDMQANLENKSTELYQAKNYVSEKDFAFNNLYATLSHKEIEISELKTLLSLKESENSQLKNNLSLLEENSVDMKTNISESKSQVAIMEEKLKHRESEVGILKESLYSSIDKNGAECTKLKVSTDSQIRDLMTVIAERESEIDSLRLDNAEKASEIDGLRLSNTDRASEIVALNSYIEDKTSEIDGLRLDNIDRTSEITILKKSLEDKISEIDGLRLDNLKLASEITALQKSLEEMTSEMDGLRHDNVKRTSEIIADKDSELDSLKDCFTNKDAEIYGLKMSISDYETEVNGLKNIVTAKESEIRVLNISFADKESEIDVLRNSFSDKDTATNDLLNSLSNRELEVNSLKCSLIDMVSEIDMLKGDLTNRESEIDELKYSLTNRESEFGVISSSLTIRESEINELKCDITNKITEIDEIKTGMANRNAEIDELKSNLTNRNAEIDDLKSDLTNRNAEIDDLKSDLTNRNAEIDDLKSDLTNGNAEIDDLKSDLTNRNAEIDDMKSDLTNGNAEIDDLKSDLTNRNAEIDDLKSDLTNRNSEINELKTSLTNSVSEIDELKTNLASMEAKFDELKSDVTNRESEFDGMRSSLANRETEINEMKTSLTNSNAEINELKRDLTNRESEINDLKISLANRETEINEMKTSLTNSNAEINELKRDLTNRESEINDLKISLANWETEINEMKTSLTNSNAEINELKRDLTNRESEIDDLKISLANRETEINEMKTSLTNSNAEIEELKSDFTNRESEIEELKSDRTNRDSEIDELKISLTNRETELNEMKTSLENRKTEINHLKIDVTNRELEFDVMSISLTNRESEINDLKSDLTNKESGIDELKTSLTNIESEMAVMRSSFTNKKSEIDELKSSLMNRETEIDEMRSNLTNKDTQIDDMTRTLINRDSEIDELKSSLTKKESDADVLKYNLTNKDTEIDEMKTNLTNRESQFDVLKSNLTNRESEIDVLKSILTNKETEIDVLKTSLTNKESEINELKTSLNSRKSEIDVLEASLAEKEAESISVKSSFLVIQSELQICKSNLVNRDLEITILKKRHGDDEAEVSHLQRSGLTVSLANIESETMAFEDHPFNKETEISLLKCNLEDKQSGSVEKETNLEGPNAENEVTLVCASSATLDNKEGDMNENIANMVSTIETLKSELSNKDSELGHAMMTLTEKESDNHGLREILTSTEMTLKQGLDEKDLELEMQKNNLTELEYEISNLRSECAKKEYAMDDMRGSFLEKESEIENLKTIIAHKHDGIDFEKDTEIEMLATSLADKDSEIDSLKSTLTLKELKMVSISNSLRDRESEIVSLLGTIKDRETEMRNISSIITAKDVELADNKSSLAMNDSDLAETKSLLAELESEIGSLQCSLKEREAEVHEMSNSISKKEAEVVNLRNSFTNKDSEISDVKSSFEEKESEVNDLRSRINETLSEMEKFKAKLNEREDELSQAVQSKHDIHADLDRIKLQLEEKDNDAKRDFAEKDSEINTLKEKLDEADYQVGKLQTNLSEAEMELVTAKDCIIQKESDISSLTSRLDEAVRRIDSLDATLKIKEDELTVLGDEILEKESKTQILSEGLSEASGHVDRLHGTIIDTNKKLVDMRHCVEKKESEIYALTEKLSEASQDSSKISTQLEEHREVTLKLDLLSTDLVNRNEKLAAMENTVAEKGLEISSLMDKLNEACSQVNLLHTCTSNADEELKALKICILRKDSEISDLTDEVYKNKCEISTLTEKLCSANYEMETLHTTLISANAEGTAVASYLTEKESVIGTLTDELRKKESEMSTLLEKFSNASSQVETLHVALISTNEALTTMKSSVEEKDSEISAFKDEASMNVSKQNTLTQELQNVEREIKTLKDTLISTNAELTTVKNSVVEKDYKICTLEERLSEASNQIISLHTSISNTEKELTSMKDCVVEKQTEINDITERLSEASNQLHTLQITVTNTEEELQAVKNSLLEKESDYSVLYIRLNEALSQNEILQTKLKEDKELLNLVVQEKDFLQSQVLTLKMQFEAMEINLHEVSAENAGMTQDLNNSQEMKEHEQSTIAQKENELAEMTSLTTDLEQQIKKLSHTLEVTSAAEEELKMEISAKEKKFELTNEKQLQEMENLNKSVAVKESTIAELEQHIFDMNAKKEQLVQELTITQRKSQLLEVTLSNLTREVQETCATVVLQELQLQEQAGKLSELTDTLQVNNNKLQELRQHNKSLQDLNETLTSESHAYLEDTAHQREALEQQVGEIEGILSQKEREISEIMQSVANERFAREQLEGQLLTLDRSYKSLLGLSSYLQEDIHMKEATIIDQKLCIDGQSSRLNDISQTLTQNTLSMKDVNDTNASLKTQIDTLQEERCDLEQRISKVQTDLDSQELIATQFMVEGKHLNEKLTLMTHDMETKEATIFDLRHDCDMYIKEINDLKQELEQKDIVSISLKEEVESAQASMEKSKEEKEMLKANFDSCMEEMQQKFGDQEIELKRLRSQLAEETKNVYHDQDQMKEIYEHQIGQMEEKMLHCEKQCERLEKELTEVKAKSASAKDVYEHQLSEQELHLQSTNSELVRVKDHMSKMINNHKCEVAGLKRLHEIQTNELEESCVTLERTIAEQKRFINEQTAKFNRERNDLEQSFEIQLSDVEEKRRLCEMEVSRLKKHLDEMKLDHEKDLQSLEKSYEARLYELEDKCCSSTNELERLRKSLMCSTGNYSEEKQALEMRIEELETLRRDLQNRNSTLEDDVIMMRDQALQREEEMRAVLKDAAEKQQEKNTEMTFEMSQLQQRLSACAEEHDRSIAEIKRNYEAQIFDLQSRNRQLEENNCSLEILINEDLTLHKDESEHGSEEKILQTEFVDLQRQVKTLEQENISLKKRLSLQKRSERTSGFTSDDKATCAPYSHSASFSENLHSEDDILGDCFSPAVDDGPIVEGFVAEPSLKFSAQRKVSRSKPSKIYSASTKKPDFVEEQCDGFQLEIAEDQTGQCRVHPIHEEAIRERFEPETPDQFLVESTEEPGSAMMWQHELSVGISHSHLQAQRVNLDFRILDQSQRNEEFHGADVFTREDMSTDFNSNCNTRDTWSGHALEKSSEDRFEKRLSHIKEELEEEYVTKMRQQELKLTLEHEAKQAEYKLEIEQHFAQRMKAVRYEWERKFNKALQKVRKEMEKRQTKEMKQLNPDHPPKQMQEHQQSISFDAGESSSSGDQDLITTEESEKLAEASDLPHKENEEFAEASDVLLEQTEISQTRHLHSQVLHELQVVFAHRDSVSSGSSTATTPTHIASSPASDRETDGDEADSSRSEVSETSSAKERFLEELEDICHQSSQDLPLEWELTSTVIESGNFELEPEHHSVWEVFDGRCIRQDCQEVRHKFHKLYQWVVKHKGDGFDVVFDGEFQMLMASANPPKDQRNLLNCPQVNPSQIHFKHSSVRTANGHDISYADLLARVLSLESDKHRLEEKLAVQINYNRKLRNEMHQSYKTLNAQLLGKSSAKISPENEILKFNDVHNKIIIPQKKELKKSDTRLEHDLFHQSLTSQRQNIISDNMELIRGHEQLGDIVEHAENHLDLTTHSLHEMFTEKEEQILMLRQENKHLRSYIDKFIQGTTSTAHSAERSKEVLQHQLLIKQQLLEMQQSILRDSHVDAVSHLLTDRCGDSIKEYHDLVLKSDTNLEHIISSDQLHTQSCNDSSTSDFEGKDIKDKTSGKHSIVKNPEQSTIETSGSEISQFSCSHLAISPGGYPATGHDSAASSSHSSILFDDSYSLRSRSETPDLQDKELAAELSRLQKDMQETKEIYSKEHVLLQEAWYKETVLKNLQIQRTLSDQKSTTNEGASLADSERSRIETQDEIEMLKQKLAICLKQNQMLEDENAVLRKQVREQAARISVFNNKDKEAEKWQKSISSQLTSLQKQRNDLLQLLRDMDSGQEPTLSLSLQGPQKKESLRQVHEDLVARMEELDHLYKMLTQRQVELQHCEVERRHLEQLCLLKDETEMQMMKQKRLMEEQLSEIEFYLRERETLIMEEKTQLLQELKERDVHQSRISKFPQQNPAHASPSEELPQSSAFGDSNLNLLESSIPFQLHSFLAEEEVLTAARDADHKHLEAVKQLRTKLKQEYVTEAARISDFQISSTESDQ